METPLSKITKTSIILKWIWHPCFVYDESTLRKNAQALKAFPHAFGLFPRYAMKAAPTAAILRIFNEEGLSIDASSVFEARGRCDPEVWNGSYFHEFPRALGRLAILVRDGVKVNLCSLNQIRKFASWGIKEPIGLRFNPGLGSGGTNRTNVGGPSSSFGIWKDDLEEAKALCRENGLEVERIHTHIGSGSDLKYGRKYQA